MTLLGPRFEDALLYASKIHGGQVRKGTTVPYISHLLQVAGVVLEYGGTEDEAIAALLHDAPEDHGGHDRLSDIRQRFGPQVARIVGECSDTLEPSKPPWRERKEAYIASIANKSEQAVRVSLADKVHNLQTILKDHEQHGDALWERFNAGVTDQLWYYGSLVEAFAGRTTGALYQEFERLVAELHRRVEASGSA